MKYWLGAVAVGLTVIAIWTLPPEGRADMSFEVKSAEDLRFEAVAEEYRRASETYRRIVWADEFVPQVTRPGDTPSVLYQDDEGLPDLQKNRFEELVANEIDALDPVENMRFALVLMDRATGTRPGMGAAAFDRTEAFAGSADGMPYCLQVRPLRMGTIAQEVGRKLAGVRHYSAPRSNSLGICALYLRHGLPGASIEGWLGRGGVTLGDERGHEERPELRVRGRSLFGMRWGDRPFNFDLCFSGDAPACAEAFQNPRGADQMVRRNIEIVEKSPALWLGFRSAYPGFSSDDGYMLADLEEEFGRTAFTDFWTSENDVLVAFEEAFGTSAGDWVVSWISQRYELDSRGPTLNRAATSGSIALIMVLLLVAFVQQRRRTVVA